MSNFLHFAPLSYSSTNEKRQNGCLFSVIDRLMSYNDHFRALTAASSWCMACSSRPRGVPTFSRMWQ